MLIVKMGFHAHLKKGYDDDDVDEKRIILMFITQHAKCILRLSLLIMRKYLLGFESLNNALSFTYETT